MNASPSTAAPPARPWPVGEVAGVDDDAISAMALAALDREIQPGSSSIGVTVHHGIATLAGHVEWPYQIGAAEHCVRRVEGVRDVVNHLSDRRESLAERIHAAIDAALGTRIGGPSWCEVHILPDGTAILYGMVRNAGEREAATKAATSVVGQFMVQNKLCVMRG